MLAPLPLPILDQFGWAAPTFFEIPHLSHPPMWKWTRSHHSRRCCGKSTARFATRWRTKLRDTMQVLQLHAGSQYHVPDVHAALKRDEFGYNRQFIMKLLKTIANQDEIVHDAEGGDEVSTQ